MPRKPKLSEDDLEEMLDMISSGLTIDQVALEVDLSVSSVYRIMRKYNIRTVRAHTAMDMIDIESLAEDYQAFVPVDEICETYVVTRSQMYGILRKMNIPARTTSSDRMEARQATMDTVVEMYQSGNTIREIIDSTGVHQPDIHTELHRRNVPLRRPQPSSVPTDDEIRETIERVMNEEDERGE